MLMVKGEGAQPGSGSVHYEVKFLFPEIWPMASKGSFVQL